MDSLIPPLDYETALDAISLISAIAPGFLISLARSRFITGRIKSVAEAGLEYVVFSAVYYAVAGPLFLWFDAPTWYSVPIFMFAAPIAIGLVFGVIHQTGVANWIGNMTRMKLTHPAPTSWDYVFGGLNGGVWIVVTLQDHAPVYGFFGDLSFAASDLTRRDLYIQDVRNDDWTETEDSGRTRSIWISEEQIVMVEIIKDEEN